MVSRDDNDENGPSFDALLGRVRAGDSSAAEELIQRYGVQVRLVVRRQLPRLLRSRFDSVDFLQSVWGSFFRRMVSDPIAFEDPRILVAFLARTARNKVIDEYRRAVSRKANRGLESPLDAGSGLVGGEDSPSEIVAAREEFVRLLNLLPEGRRVILELRVEGLSTREIGDRLGISERTVRRVLEDLRRRSGFEETGEGHP